MSKLCDTCIYRNNVEQLKPCIIYRDDCELYEKEKESMTKDDFIFNLKRCGCLYKDGNIYYEENELIKCFEDVGAFNQPSVNPQEPKMGYWINIFNKDLHDYRTGNKLCFECSECRSQYTYKSNYCPNCGARMVEPQESEV